MKQTQFEALYAEQWRRFAGYLKKLESGSNLRKRDGLEENDYNEFARLYRRVCHYHALARDRDYSVYLIDQLADLVVRGHQQFYRRRTVFADAFLRFFVAEFPQLVRREISFVSLATALLYLPALALLLAVLWQPTLVYAMMSVEQVQNFEAMYNPANDHFGSARDAETNWHMFGFYIQNNIGVAFRTFASGLVWGLGSVFFLVFNGLAFGAVAGHLTTVGFHQPFYSFVIGHGSFELTAIVIAGAAGLKLGYSLLAPGSQSRLASLRQAAGVAIKLIYGVILMLTLAAFVEAFWSSSGYISFATKYWGGVLLWVLVLAYLALGGRRGAE